MKTKLLRSTFTCLLALCFIISCLCPFNMVVATTKNAGTLTDINLSVYPGSNVNELNFNWITKYEPEKAIVQIAPFQIVDDNFKNFESVAEQFIGKKEKTMLNTNQGNDVCYWYSNKVTADGLLYSSKYLYRVGDGISWSPIKMVTTGDLKETSAYIVTDVHIIENLEQWGRPLQVSIDNWDKTLEKLDGLNKANMILSLGDQMQDTTKVNYLEGFFNRELLSNYPIAPINGNHDIAPSSSNLPYFTNTPNSQPYGDFNGISDYFFKYGNVLFVMLSITTINFSDVDHDKTFEAAIAAYPDYDWLVVCCHESIYGMTITNYTSDKGSPQDYTYDFYKPYIKCFDDFDVDMVLTGHSHNYSRSYFMKEGEKQQTTKNELGQYVDPNGTVYLNMGITGDMWELRSQAPKPGFPYSYLNYFLEGSAKDDEYVYGNTNDVATFGVLETEKDTLTVTAYDYYNPEKTRDSITIKKTSIEVPVEEKENDAKKGCTSSIGASSILAFSALMVGTVISLNRKKDEER